MTPADELKLINKIVRTSDRTWASERGLALLRQISIGPVRAIESHNTECFSLDMNILRESKSGPFWRVRMDPTPRGGVRVWVYPPFSLRYELVGETLRELPGRPSMSLSFMRKPVSFSPKDLATPTINAYAIEVGMRAQSSATNLIRNPEAAFELNQLDLNAIFMAESLGVSVQEAIPFARKSYQAKHGSASSESSDELALPSFDGNIFSAND